MTDTLLARRLVLQAVSLMAAGLLPAFVAVPAQAAADPLVVIAEIVAKPGSEDALRAVMEPLAAASRHEPGCRHYVLLEDRQNPGRFMTYEVWTNQAALAAHMQAPAAKAAGPKLGGLLAKAPTQAMLKSLSAS